MKQLTFDKPFHPRGLMQDATPMRWMQVGPDRWRGVVTMKNGGGQAGTSMNVALTMHVVSPTHIDGTTTVTVKMPPQFAAMMGGGSGTCRSVVRAKMSWSE